MRIASLAALSALLMACDDTRRVPSGPVNPRPTTRDAGARDDARASDAAAVSPDANALEDAAIAPRFDAQIADTAVPQVDASASPDAAVATARYYGSVFVSQTAYTAVAVTSLTAGFSEPLSPSPCTPLVFGACTAYRCPASQPATPPPAEAGLVTARISGQSFSTAFSAATGYYQPQTVMQRVWTGGERIDFAASGGRIPAFAHALTAPSLLTLSQPALPPPQDSYLIVRGSDLAVRWTGAGSGEAVITMGGSGGPSGSTSVTCVFPSNAGAGTVPSAAIGALPSDGTRYSFTLSSRAYDQIRAGDADVFVQAYANATTPQGDNASRIARLGP